MMVILINMMYPSLIGCSMPFSCPSAHNCTAELRLTILQYGFKSPNLLLVQYPQQPPTPGRTAPPNLRYSWPQNHHLHSSNGRGTDRIMVAALVSRICRGHAEHDLHAVARGQQRDCGCSDAPSARIRDRTL